MADYERDLADCVGAIYEAATRDEGWLDVGERICRIFDAQTAVFRVDDGGRNYRNLLRRVTPAEALYTAYFHSVDPFRAQARQDFLTGRARHLGTAKLGSEILPEDIYLRSEFYADFARQNGMRHMMAGMVGVSFATPLSLYRNRSVEAFDQRDIRRLETLLPHLQRALELQVRLGRQTEAALNSRAALDALPLGLVLVDAGLGVRFANAAAIADLSRPGAPAVLVRSGSRLAGATCLSPRHRVDAAKLRQFVASATSGGAGGSFRLHAEEVSADQAAAVVMMISPTPSSLAAEAGAALEPLALVAVQNIARNVAPSAEVLCDVFGFSRSEAEVAVALCGGVGAEEVAERRVVSLGTVRSQVRALLEKSGAVNLRDLERVLAHLATLTRQAGS